MKLKIKFTNKLGVYILTGKALKNYHKMQVRPTYNRYRQRLKNEAQKNKSPYLPIPFDDYLQFYMPYNKIPIQMALIK